MNCKRLSALVLALAMTASTAAFAVEAVPTSGVLISDEPLTGNYDTMILMNGEALESYEYTRDIPGTWETETLTVRLKDLPAVPEGYVPLRAIAQADRGSASWYQDMNQSFFYFAGTSIVTDFNDMSILVGDEKVEGAQAILLDGTTYVPVSVLESIEGITVTDSSRNGWERYKISTPNGAPLMKLAYSMMETAGVYGGMENTPEDLETYWGETHGFKAEYMPEGVVFTGMMTSPDTLGIGRVAEGQEEALAAAFESYRKQQEDTFSWYLSQNLPKVENAQFVTEDDWFLFVIGENADEAVEQFRSTVQAMNAPTYDTVITVNGEAVESYTYSQDIPGWGSEEVTVSLSELPAVPDGYVPLRAIAQADHGSASWYEGSNEGSFSMSDARIKVSFEDFSVTVGDQTLEGVEALLLDGVTYVPVSVFESMEGVSVTDNSTDEGESYEITTPNGTPLMKLAYQIAEDSALLRGSKRTMEQMEEWYGEQGFKSGYTTEGVAFLPMMTYPDTLVLGKMAEGQEEALAAFLEEYRAGQESTFTWYLGQHLPKVQNAQFVTEGDWFLFLIAEDVEAGVETFRSAVQEME